MHRSSLAPARARDSRPSSRASGREPIVQLQRPSAAVRAIKAAPQVNRPLVTIVSVLALVSLLGLPYYLLPMTERVRSPWHPWLRPSGYVGQTAGILSLAIFVFLWLYPLRKRVRWLAFTGSIARWLDVHVVAALALPLLVAIHAGWRFEGVIGLGAVSMLVVCVSGVIGRYLYVRIPRSMSGLELTVDDMVAQRKAFLKEIAGDAGLPLEQVEAILRADPTPCEGLGLLGTLAQMVRDDAQRWRTARALRRTCRGLDRATLKQVLRLASREMALTQQARMLNATHRVFRFWHVAHRPFAITALIAVAIHVAVVVSLGATWFW